jgi:hypothetical protein
MKKIVRGFWWAVLAILATVLCIIGWQVILGTGVALLLMWSIAWAFDI